MKLCHVGRAQDSNQAQRAAEGTVARQVGSDDHNAIICLFHPRAKAQERAMGDSNYPIHGALRL